MEPITAILLNAATTAAFSFSGYLKNKAKDKDESLDWIELGKITLAGLILGAGAKLGLQLDEATSIGLSLFVVTIGKNVYKFITAHLPKRK